jgi:nicotinamidase-related amidase
MNGRYVDITYGFTDPDAFLGSNLDSQVEQINRLLDSAHANSVPIIVTTVSYDETIFAMPAYWRKNKKVSITCAPDRKWWNSTRACIAPPAMRCW